MMYASFFAGMRAPPVMAQAWAAFDLKALLLMSIERSNAKSASIKLSEPSPNMLRGACEAGGNVNARAVVVTPMFTIVGVEPDTSTGEAGPAQVACVGAPVQEMVTLTEPVTPAASAS